MGEFTTILVANRGEIALRVMRTARALGMRTVAVYADPDSNAPHVRFAHDAVRLGPAPASESYLSGEKIIQAALDTGAQAIHPGYGFLSENTEFAQAVTKAGLVFVGPPAAAIDVMGDKARAKRTMLAAGVPCVPGYQGEEQSELVFEREAQRIGFPVMVKASAGGGGRGIRLVEQAKALPGALALARSEAQNAFGCGDLILEKAIMQPRHVEIQVFADAHGNVIHLGERDCSVQRRHQKVIEEAPCPVMSADLRERMGAAAVAAAAAVDYRGAGTVEFLLDGAGEFYFLEMNTRLQVEHPVTEQVTGMDLVAMQLRVAAGQPLGLTQADVTLRGHAIEVRLYAENPAANFLPSTGQVHLWQAPGGEEVRVDDGICTGSEISPFYDSMLAKIIATGDSRADARARLLDALHRCALFGPHTNRDFLIDALTQPAFVAGEATTAFIEQSYGDAGFTAPALEARDYAVAAVLQYLHRRARAHAQALDVNDELLNWASTGALQSVVAYEVDGEMHNVVIETTAGAERADAFTLRIADTQVEVAVRPSDSAPCSVMRLLVDGQGCRVVFHHQDERTVHIAQATRSYCLTDVSGGEPDAAQIAGSGQITAPMHGQLLEICVSTGEQVARGDKLAVLEAMKMQHEIVADVDGVVAEVHASAKQQIGADDLIVQIEITPAE